MYLRWSSRRPRNTELLHMEKKIPYHSRSSALSWVKYHFSLSMLTPPPGKKPDPIHVAHLVSWDQYTTTMSFLQLLQVMRPGDINRHIKNCYAKQRKRRFPRCSPLWAAVGLLSEEGRVPAPPRGFSRFGPAFTGNIRLGLDDEKKAGRKSRRFIAPARSLLPAVRAVCGCFV